MRISPKTLSEAVVKAKASAQSRDEASRQAAEAEALEAAANITSPADIDAGRAQRLVERASALASSGDSGAAILAARQALALSPANLEAHLLYAGLLESKGDLSGARAAYEKSALLAPDRADARAHVERLDASLQKPQAPFAQTQSPVESSVAAAPVLLVSDVAPATPQSASSSSSAALEVDSMAMFDESMFPALEARLPPSRLESGGSELAATISEKEPASSDFSAPSELVVAPVEQPAKAAPAPIEVNRRKHNIPVATERRRSPAMAGAAPLSAAVGASAAAPVAAPARAQAAVGAPLSPARPRSPLVTPLDNPFDGDVEPRLSAPTARSPLSLDVPVAAATPLWQQVASRPSFYARTLPVVGVALLSLGFLSWARGRAVSQVVAPAPTELAMTDVPVAPSTVPGTTLPAPIQPAQPGAPGTDASGFPISNAPAVFQAPAVSNDGATGASTANVPATGPAPSRPSSPARANNSVPSAPARASNRGPNSSSSNSPRVLPPARPVPNFPGVSLAPAPIPPASARNTIPRPSGDGSSIVLPSPNIPMNSPSEPIPRALPPTDNGLNPAGSPNRGYVRVTEGRVGNGLIPAQPSAVARENERQANDAARNGQDDQAISQLSQAIRADSDNTGFRYQQRATLFLQRGDYSRATDDFQTAISAYQDQIASGKDVAAARRGLRSARSGLNLALAGKRN